MRHTIFATVKPYFQLRKLWHWTKKGWAEKNGLNPVLYIDNSSTLTNNFFEHFFDRAIGDVDKISQFSIEQKYVLDIVRYMKRYQGDLVREGKPIIKDYRFSDEREWRYVLDPNSAALLFVNAVKLKGEKLRLSKIKYNDRIKDVRLAFEPEDINYIIVKKEIERDSLIRNLEKTKGKYPMEQVKRLTSRIISTEQIKTDF